MNDETEIYRSLQQHLDKLPIGYPPTKSGVEIRLLKYFFTPEEARIATYLSITPEPVTHIYGRAKKSGISLEELQNILDRMEHKVCITTCTEGDIKLYKNSVLAINGMFESMVNQLTPEFMQDFGQYIQEAFGRELFRVKNPQLRTIPVEKSIPLPEKYPVSSYDNVRELIANNTGRLAVANCICRQAMDLAGESCQVTDLRETCLLLDGEQFINAGLARPVTREEAIDILEKAQEAGLVLQPYNSQRPEVICCCCGDCCGILRTIKQFPHPADYYASNHYAEIDPELCTGCQICIERCQLDAPFMTNGVASVNLDRCIGCGNCVVLCQDNAVHLRKKDKETIPPKDRAELYQRIAAVKEGK